MASVAVYPHGHSRPLHRSAWNKQLLAIAKAVALETIAGVGAPDADVWEDGEITAIVRRLCADEERRKVLEKYAPA